MSNQKNPLHIHHIDLVQLSRHQWIQLHFHLISQAAFQTKCVPGFQIYVDLRRVKIFDLSCVKLCFLLHCLLHENTSILPVLSIGSIFTALLLLLPSSLFSADKVNASSTSPNLSTYRTKRCKSKHIIVEWIMIMAGAKTVSHNKWIIYCHLVRIQRDWSLLVSDFVLIMMTREKLI